jgi:hypothetical protein
MRQLATGGLLHPTGRRIDHGNPLQRRQALLPVAQHSHRRQPLTPADDPGLSSRARQRTVLVHGRGHQLQSARQRRVAGHLALVRYQPERPRPIVEHMSQRMCSSRWHLYKHRWPVALIRHSDHHTAAKLDSDA